MMELECGLAYTDVIARLEIAMAVAATKVFTSVLVVNIWISPLG
jgi:hypothetical protein